MSWIDFDLIVMLKKKINNNNKKILIYINNWYIKKNK